MVTLLNSYHSMNRCWQFQPQDRPTATDLAETLKQMSNISLAGTAKVELSGRQSESSVISMSERRHSAQTSASGSITPDAISPFSKIIQTSMLHH